MTKIHLADMGRTVPYCKPKTAASALTVTHDLEKATCKTCINLATLGRR